MSIDVSRYQDRMNRFRDRHFGGEAIFDSAEALRNSGDYGEALQHYERIEGYDPIVLFRIAETMDLLMKQLPLLKSAKSLSDRVSYYERFAEKFPASYEQYPTQFLVACNTLADSYKRGIGCQRDTNKAAYYDALAAALASPDSP